MLLVPSKKIVIEFAEAIRSQNLPHLYNLLDDNGEFPIQDDFTLEDRDTNKKEFIQWLEKRLQRMKQNRRKVQYQFDECLHCAIGNPVVIFNKGKFPRIPNNIFEREKTGLMLEVKNEKIKEIRFCFVFAHNKNPYICDKRPALLKKYRKSGMNQADSFKKVAVEIGQKYLNWL